ncbi:MAG TPA: ATP-binding protein [Steroidobacteraceae bacterium]|nr:ATP-binding protein [Steroidobacteraceae bacterium]
MKSIGARLALWYAATATGTLLCLCVAGYYLLQVHLVNGLDLLNRAQFEQIKAHLGDDYASLNARLIDARIRETTEYSSVLFFITIDDRVGPVRPIFYSTNLHGVAIPDVPGKRVYDAPLPGIGELRVAEFILGPFDVTVATPLSSVREALREYSQICGWLLAIMAAISVAVGLALSRLALRPVRLIRETANRISSDNLSERIPVAPVRDEISDLALLLNQMFDRLEVAFNQIRRFTAEASHELKTPLSLIRLQAEKLLVHGNLDAANEESVHEQLEELTRLSQIIEELLFLSRAESRDMQLGLAAHDPEVLLANFTQDARVLAEHSGVQFKCAHRGHGIVQVEPRWLRRVLLNLLTNALHASPPNGTVMLDSAVSEREWRVSLSDQGPGVAAENLQRIFERFFRIAAADGAEDDGSGLGLAICKSIIGLHGGEIWAEAAPYGTGLQLVFRLPAIASHTGRAERSAPAAPADAHLRAERRQSSGV